MGVGAQDSGNCEHKQSFPSLTASHWRCLCPGKGDSRDLTFPSFLPLTLMNTRTKGSLRGKCSFASQLTTLRGGNPLTSFSPRLAQRPFQHTQTHLIRDCSARSGLGPPTSISNQENSKQICPQANMIEALLNRDFFIPGVSRFVSN